MDQNSLINSEKLSINRSCYFLFKTFGGSLVIGYFTGKVLFLWVQVVVDVWVVAVEASASHQWHIMHSAFPMIMFYNRVQWECWRPCRWLWYHNNHRRPPLCCMHLWHRRAVLSLLITSLPTFTHPKAIEYKLALWAEELAKVYIALPHLLVVNCCNTIR